MDRKWLKDALRDIATFGQMGMYVVVPPIMMALLGFWLRKKFGLGSWVIIVAIVMGLLSAFTSIYRLCMGFLAKSTKEDDKNKIKSYRRHE